MQQHLLQRYPEGMKGLPSPEHRLVDRYYATKREREGLVGQASRFITIKYENKKYYPVFDPRFEKEVGAMHFKILELEKLEEDLLTRIDQLSAKFEMDIRGLHEEKSRIETSISSLNLFPEEQDALRKQHLETVKQIEEYKGILGDI